MTNTQHSGWSEVTDDELQALRPFILDCEDLSDAARAQVRKDFRHKLAAWTKAVATEFKRPPTQAEVDILRRACAKYFNEIVIPALAPRGLMH